MKELVKSITSVETRFRRTQVKGRGLVYVSPSRESAHSVLLPVFGSSMLKLKSQVVVSPIVRKPSRTVVTIKWLDTANAVQRYSDVASRKRITSTLRKRKDCQNKGL